ncbi:response regulator [Bacteroides thetaiotaomicron]|nr:response regulator [Bacteroides thetaiotaomicron]MCG4881065.1 response regulator [Bacteroides thetaiotaomicron]MCQ5250148.1 response regulator [Bacteroides thetaiotaomicron]
MEDIESNFAQLNILLKKEYIILWVRNGQEAINSFIREKPDLILMDIRMPVMDSIQAGYNAVFSKPYSLEKLKETIEIYIG